ncbi:uncharacterized protein DS421_8g248900 [Arachis hypogaea]|nr:uncharacterized protein DS421_8g248900 [Arachis hypogaea]
MLNKFQNKKAFSWEVIPGNKEIKEIVWDCESTKTPLLDGFNFIFQEVPSFFVNGKLPRKSNRNIGGTG